MEKLTPIRTWTLSLALLTCVGCAGSHESPEADANETTSESTGAVGKLESSFAASARQHVCVTFKEDLDGIVIDEFQCSTGSGAANAATQFECGGCTMDLLVLENYDWTLTARTGSSACEQLAGSYLIRFGDSMKACSMPSEQP